MAGPVEPTVYAGTADQLFNTNLLVHTAVDYAPEFREVIFNATPLLQALSIAAFGNDKVIKTGSYGNADQGRRSTGKGIVFRPEGGSQYEFSVMTSAPVGVHVGRLGNINPQHNEPGATGAYAFRRMVWSVMIPEEFVRDNRGNARMLNRLDTEFQLAKMAAVRDLDYLITGSSSAPSGGGYGLNALVSVTQSDTTTNAGNIGPSTYSYWQNVKRECASVGGGGELDRPLAFLRKMESLLIDIRQRGGSSDNQLLVGTRGAYQYLRRAVYADSTGAGNNPGLRMDIYNTAGLEHTPFMGCPMIYDGNVQVPTGATAGTEAVYALDLSSFGLHVKRDEFFRVEPWEGPSVKDRQRYFQMNVFLRYFLATTNRRIQGVLYNLPANADAS